MKKVVLIDNERILINETCTICQGKGKIKHGILSIFNKTCDPCGGWGNVEREGKTIHLYGKDFTPKELNGMIDNAESWLKEHSDKSEGAWYIGGVLKLVFHRGKVRQDLLGGLSHFLNAQIMGEKFIDQMKANKVAGVTPRMQKGGPS